MKVRMLKATYWDKFLNVGDEFEINAMTGERWIQKGIAESTDPESFIPNSSGSNDDPSNSGADEELEELRDRAKGFGIKNAHNMKKETLEKLIHAYLDELTEALDKAAVLDIEGYEDMSLSELTKAIEAAEKKE